MPIKVLKASAGSGKTYRLTNDYIELLNNSSHNQILAVTFTNKATEEMKSRIIKELNDRAKKGDENAKELINIILHDYSHFNVSTIDKFFQKIVRSMFRELGFSGLYNLVLDNAQLIEESIDEMRMNLDQYTNAYSLLLEHAIGKLKEGKDWSFSNELKTLTRLLWKEEFMNLTPEKLSLYTYENVKQFFSECITEKEKILNEWVQLASEAKRTFVSVGLDLKKDSSAGILSRLDTFIVKKINFFTEKQREKLSLEKVLTKDNFKKYAADLVASGFDKAIAEFSDSYNKNLSRYQTINAVISHAIYLPVIVEIYSLIRNRLAERNEFLLSDINHLLAGMISDSDAPFIYEKIGSQLTHYLLDEFQDTSTMQWHNFIPLIEESVSGNNENLVVGDIKQSVYRWRNSDWNILAHKIKDKFNSAVVEETLGDNWRSKREIINFNNIFFYKLKEYLNREEIRKAYSNFTQTISNKRASVDGGYVKWRFFKKSAKEDLVQKQLDIILLDVQEILSKGYSKSDIGILVRNNDTGITISKFLLENNINVISAESLYISSHNDVKLLIFLLKSVVAGQTELNKLILESLRCFSPEELEEINKAATLPLFEQVERYIQILKLSEKTDSVIYIQAFQDLVFDYNQKHSSDINGFLKWWKLEGYKKSVQGGSQTDAVNIMTIHKSKGLDFPVVLMPRFDWKLSNTDEIKWFKNSSNFIETKLPLVPLNVNKALEGTVFEEEYKTEMLYKEIDSVNLLYVAMTRARDAMFIYSLEKSGSVIYDWGKEALAKSAPFVNEDDSDAERAFISKTISEYGDINLENEDDEFIVYSKGELSEKSEKIKEQTTIQCNCGYPSLDYKSSKIKLNLQTENSLSQHKGNVLHGILQFIKTRDDAPKAVKKAERMGLISSSEVEYIKSELDEILNHPLSAEWYDGTYQNIWNERTIISNELYRPDRIMEKDGELLVVDYKFGEQNDKYFAQIKNYIKLLKQMNKWSNVRGCLYYHKTKILQWV